MASPDPQTPSSSLPDSTSAEDPKKPSYFVSSPLFPTSSEASPSLASTLPPPVHDVFISFRGRDTRSNFTSHLFHRLHDLDIRTYLDKFELRPGENIWDSLVQAIQKSKMYVVVFSEKYASSSWCLNELIEISKCYQLEKRLVVGVYCNIEPAVVRWQSGSFKESFINHEARVAEMKKVGEKVSADQVKEVAAAAKAETEKIEGWRDTLKNVAAISGLPVTEERTQADIINEVVAVILQEIKPKILPVPKNAVGLDPRVTHITKLLSTHTEEGVIKIGLCGMGGVGKSTLAKALYNQLLLEGTFKRSCFLGEVREASQIAGGLQSLQEKLLNEVSKSKNIFKVGSVDEGIDSISKRICSEKVLLLIDDINKSEQYESLVGPFASGSVVIITTRNKKILKSIGVETKYLRKVKMLDKAESLTLFTQYAFGSAKPADNSLTGSIDEILSLANGLPLALKVFGAHLFTLSDKLEWESYIDKLKLNPDSTIQEKLVISLNALKFEDPKLEKLFLDIACFFNGRKRQEVVDILGTYYHYVDSKIDILKERCLLDDDSDTLRMHELLRDIARDVVRNNSHDDQPEKHSRLWLTKDICRVLKNRKGTEAIEGIVPSNFYHQDAFEGVSFAAATSTFERMNILRFLYIKNVDLSGSFENIFENLTWLHWDGCHLECLPSDFCPENLVILALRSSKMKTMWMPNMDSQVFNRLKTLDMSYSLDLTITPDFNKLPRLEVLNLEGCKSLTKVDVSIVWLVSLASVNLGGCVNLKNLPDNICNLRALKSLNVGGCTSLEALPIEVGNIESLTELSAWGLATVSKIPDSIIRLTKLVQLNLSDNAYGTPSPSRTPSPPTSWDVFLSFRGSDTRYSFTSHLYSALDRHGIRTFMDDPELLSGEVISDAMLRAIHESKTYIVVFSENYASSAWCLDELVEILNCCKTLHRLVIPVFYCIDPVVVRHQTQCFKQPFKKHQARFEMNKVNKWRHTLKEVASYSGLQTQSSGRSEAEIINNIVETILVETNPMSLDVPKYPVGLDSRVENLTALLSSETEGVIKIGLYGMGGVGKTTLARALYNQLLLRSFKGVCFLAKVREVSRTTKGLVSLQQQLINDVLGTKKVQVHNVDQGTKMIQSIICLSQILVVIDDLGDHKHFESLVGPFASGSVVIVTTRDEEILDKIEVEPEYRYMVNVLSYAESLELFTRHAFRNDIPDNTLMELSNDILHHAGGLPLALVTSGSYLYKQSEVAWIDHIIDLNQLHELNLSDNYGYGIPPSPTSWDVFLSFRGLDTRHGFISHLYDALYRHRVRIFRDDLELPSGEAMSNGMIRAIRESKTYIVVFSEHYASSSWCLDELLEILESHETMKRSIIVVYYNIEPWVVRYQMGNFKAAFEKHETRYKGKLEKVDDWRRALKKVADYSGYLISKSSDEANIVKEVVDTVLLELKPIRVSVAKYPVGLDSHVKGITTLLSSDTKRFIEFGIYGMGGVGKTTLAKALYNQLLLEGSFKHSCFLREVREASRRASGLLSLQQQLIDDVLRSKRKVNFYDVEQGNRVIRDRLSSTKVLVVIDDVDDIEQYKSLVGPFASGSVAIITTRDEEILDIIKVEPKYRYRVNELEDADSLALFSLHACGNNKLDNTLMALSEDILRHADGLPLALVVFGSYLSRKPEAGWKSYIEKLKRIPDSIIAKQLTVSLDALESKEKEMFLDIACFFIGRKKEDLVRIMETYYSYADDVIDILKKRCLLTFNNRDEVGMHNLLQDIGRDVAHKNSAWEPGKHSRLWVLEDIIDVLKEDKGTKSIEGIIPDYHGHQGSLEGLSFDAEAFRRMKTLRFLYLKNVNLTGSFEQIFKNLRFLCWEGCPLKCLPSKFHPRKLVILELRHSKMTTMWEQNMASEVFDKLTTLDMSYSLDLTTTPDFSILPCLKTLILEGCESLEEVHISIGSLLRLVSLSLKYCCNVTSLSNLKQLEFLDITGCGGLTEIQGLEELTSLRELYLGGCKSSLLASILTRRIFQIYSGVGHQIRIYIQAVEFPDWIRQLPDWIQQSSTFGSTASFNLPPYVSHNFLAMILCFKNWGVVTYGKKTYSIKNTRSGFIWNGSYNNNYPEVQIIIVPRSIFSLKDGDERIEITANAEILGIHLLHRTEITMIDQSDSSLVNVVEERLLYRTEITMLDQSESPNVNVVEERLLYNSEITMTDQSESPNVNVVEERLLYNSEITMSDQSESPNVNVVEERLLHNSEITMTDQSESPNVNVVEERLLHNSEITMTDKSESPNVNVVEERLLHNSEITMTDQYDTPNVSVVEERWHPSKWLKLLWVRPFWHTLLIWLRIYFWKKFKNICYLFWPSWILYWVRRRLGQYKEDRKKRGQE